MKNSTTGYLLTLLAVLLAWLGISALEPPRALPEDAPAEQFSAQRALAHVHAIAQEPHAMGTEAHDRARAHLVETLESLGLTPEIQETVAISGWGVGRLGRVVNVLARVPGSESSGQAVLFMAHYDSVAQGPGASDDGSGVAALLETLRALEAGPQLRNDLIFLFTDGEEAGLLGARAFNDRHPWADDVVIAVNFEARGTRGPALMFETSDGNGRLISEFARAVSDPRATSYSYEIYKMLPNDTDFSVFRRKGVAGLNFAYIHGGMGYHTMQDSIERLDPKSLQHHGDSALGLARHLGGVDLGGAWKTTNATYFNLIGSVFFKYPQALVLPFTIVLVLLTVALWVFGLRRGRLQLGRSLLGIVVHLLLAGLFGFLISLVARPLLGRYNFELDGSSSVALITLGLVLAVIGVLLFLGGWLAKLLGAENLNASGLLLGVVLATAIAFQAPGANYLFAWPVFFGLAAAFTAFARPEEEEGETSWILLVLLVLLVTAVVLLWAPTLSLLSAALGAGAAMIVVVLSSLLITAFTTPAVARLSSSRWSWAVSVVLIAVGLVVVFTTKSQARISPENRAPVSLFYALDNETGEARWMSFDRGLRPWQRQFLGENPEREAVPAYLGIDASAFQAEAPVLDVEGAELRVLAEESGESGWTAEIEIGWPHRVHRAVFRLPKARIGSLSVDGETLDLGDWEGDHLVTGYFAPRDAGTRLELTLEGREPFEIEATSHRYELPEGEGFSYEPMPADLMPGFRWSPHSTFVRDVLTLEPGMVELEDGAAAEGEAAEEETAEAAAEG